MNELELKIYSHSITTREIRKLYDAVDAAARGGEITYVTIYGKRAAIVPAGIAEEHEAWSKTVMTSDGPKTHRDLVNAEGMDTLRKVAQLGEVLGVDDPFGRSAGDVLAEALAIAGAMTGRKQ